MIQQSRCAKDNYFTIPSTAQPSNGLFRRDIKEYANRQDCQPRFAEHLNAQLFILKFAVINL